MKKYQNEKNVPLFTKGYEDPYRDRKREGPLRPSEPLASGIPNFKLDEEFYYCWFGHSTILVHMNHKNILIDPVFSSHVYPMPGMFKRYPGKVISTDDLPSLDYVLISHCHYDHLDIHTIKKIDKKVKKYIVAKGVERYMPVSKDKIVSLDWYEQYENIICTPSQHSAYRYLIDKNQSLWCSFVLKGNRYQVFYTGDGGFNDHFEEIYRRYGGMDIVFCECGQYNEKWHGLHMFPEEGIHACQLLHAKVAIPVHWGAYTLSNHYYLEPVIRFKQRGDEVGIKVRIPIINKTESRKE